MVLSRMRDRLNRRRLRAVGILAASAAGMMCVPAWGLDYHWAVANGTWNSGPNWSPSGEPGSADGAYVDLQNANCTVVNTVPTVALTYVDNGDTLSIERNGTTNGVLNTTDAVVTAGSAIDVTGHTGSILFGGVGQLSVTTSTTGLDVEGVLNEIGTGASVTVGPDASNGQKSLVVDDNGSYNLSGGLLTAGFALVIGTFNLNSGTANVGGISSEFKAVSGSVIQSSGEMNVGTLGSVISGPYVLQGGTFSSGNMRMTGGTVSYNGGTLTSGTVTLNGSAQLHLSSGGGKVFRATGINIGTISGGAFDGGIDLADNAMIVDYTGTSPLSSIVSMMQNGSYNGITQNATGIVSSTAIINGGSSHPTTLAYSEASALGISTFEGQPVDSTCVLVRYTFVGDANLDGTVNALDFNALATNYGLSGRVWTQGDFNHDGIVNSLDFAALAANYGQTIASGAAMPLATTVPEAGTAMAALAVMFVSRRLRCR